MFPVIQWLMHRADNWVSFLVQTLSSLSGTLACFLSPLQLWGHRLLFVYSNLTKKYSRGDYFWLIFPIRLLKSAVKICEMWKCLSPTTCSGPEVLMWVMQWMIVKLGLIFSLRRVAAALNQQIIAVASIAKPTNHAGNISSDMLFVLLKLSV